MPARPRTRLAPQDRRASLLQAGAELFGTEPYDSVHIEDVARRADCSKALLYHYFPTKRDLFVSVVRETSGQILGTTEPDPAARPLDQLTTGVRVYLDWAQANSARYQAIYRAASNDADIRGIVRAGRLQQEKRILRGMPAEIQDRPDIQLIVHGWCTFVTSLCLDWLDDDSPVGSTKVGPQELAAMCVGTLQASLTTALTTALTPST